MSKLSGSFSREYREQLRERMWQAQDGACAICGFEMLPADRDHGILGWTLEHVWPRSRYGRVFRHMGNLTLTHADCNNAKGSRNPTGCEIIMLESVNAQLGFRLTEKPMRNYRDPVIAPSALAIALQARGLAA